MGLLPWRVREARATEKGAARGAARGAGSVLPVHGGLARAARLVAQAGSADAGLGWTAVLEQLGRTVEALAEADIANARAEDAAYLRGHAGRVLAGVGAGRGPATPPAAAASRGVSVLGPGVEKER